MPPSIHNRRRSPRLLALAARDSSSSSDASEEQPPTKRRRGRPRKVTPNGESDVSKSPEKKTKQRSTRSSATSKTTAKSKAKGKTNNSRPCTKTKAKAIPAVDCLPRHFEEQVKQEMIQKHAYLPENCHIIGIDEAGRGPLAGPVVIAGVVCPTDIPGITDSKKITKEDDREALYEEIMKAYEQQNENATTPHTLQWAVCVMDAAKIDEINILQATLEGMKAVAQTIMGITPTAKSLVENYDGDEEKVEYVPLPIVNGPSIQEEGCYVVCSDNVRAKHKAKENTPKNDNDAKSQQQQQQQHYHALVDGNRLPKEMPCPADPIVKGDSKEFCIGAASILAKVTRDRLMHSYSKLYPSYNLQQHKGYPTAAHMAAVHQHGASKIHRRSFAPLKHMDLDENGKILE